MIYGHVLILHKARVHLIAYFTRPRCCCTKIADKQTEGSERRRHNYRKLDLCFRPFEQDISQLTDRCHSLHPLPLSSSLPLLLSSLSLLPLAFLSPSSPRSFLHLFSFFLLPLPSFLLFPFSSHRFLALYPSPLPLPQLTPVTSG